MDCGWEEEMDDLISMGEEVISRMPRWGAVGSGGVGGARSKAPGGVRRENMARVLGGLSAAAVCPF